ncbi:methyltransferase family protein [Diaminobutyricimonas aerilata]|uniref:Methyltransferase family protein n=2 Tax=Diaminobutyricimonas aerilata TaxID=1162967 RepID=A0A2M9CP15_9MICO|nr:methyltransferase family protein [Diaminobutyricimonas aerilata]
MVGAEAAHARDHAEVLDLDADVVGHLEELTAWVGAHLRDEPTAVLDIGAGSGSGTLALAERFPRAEIVALDESAQMIDHLERAASASGLADRIRTVRADADEDWPAIGTFDLAWASSSLHHMRNPDRVLRSARAALAVDGVLAVVEMDGLPRFLPPESGSGRPGLEERCRAAMAGAGWNAHPDWSGHLRSAGFDLVEQRTFSYLRAPAPPLAWRYAERVFTNVRAHLADRLAPHDLEAIDELLDDRAPGSLAQRRDLVVRSARTIWLARRG